MRSRQLKESPQIESSEEIQPKISYPSCEECAWKNENLAGISPCEYCIRNSGLVSKRWKGPKELTIKGIQMTVPRDMYISKEMLEFFKILISIYTKENEMLQAILERSKVKNPPIYEPIWEHPYWGVKTMDNKSYTTTWLSCEARKRNQIV